MKRLLPVLTLFLLGTGTQAFAQATKGGGYTSGRNEVYINTGFLGIGSGSSQYDLGPGFNYVPLPKISWLQIGGELTYQKLSYKGGSTKSTMIVAGVTANLGGTGLNDDFFIELGIGIRSGSSDVTDGSDNPGGTGVAFLVGKRIPIGGAFSFRPSAGMISGGSSQLIFRPLGLSYFF